MAINISTSQGPDNSDATFTGLDGFYAVGPGAQVVTPAVPMDSVVIENESNSLYLLATVTLTGTSFGTKQILVGPSKMTPFGFKGSKISSITLIPTTPPVTSGAASSGTPDALSAFTAIVSFIED